MIQLERATWDVLLASRTLRAQVVATWHLDGALDVTDRLSDYSRPVESMGSYLGGYSIGVATVVLENTDGYLSPLGGATTSILANKPEQDIYLTKFSLSLRIDHPAGGYEDVPMYTGYVKYATWASGTVSLSLSDIISASLSAPLPETITVGHYSDRRPWLLFARLMDDYTALDSTADVQTESAGFFDSFTEDIDWPLTGNIASGTAVGDALTALARCCMFALSPAADGSLSFLSCWPQNAGFAPDVFPHLIDDSVAWDFQFAQGMTGTATEVQVAYRGVSATYRDTTLESKVGRLQVGVDMPFLSTYSQALYAARFLYEMHGGFTNTVRFSMGAPGVALRPWDRVRVKDPMNDSEYSMRVVSRSPSTVGYTFEAAEFKHEDTIVNADFAYWNSTNWDAEDVL